MKLELPTVVLAMLKQRGGFINAEQRASQEQLVSTCEKYGYLPHAAVMAFEAAFGGLVIPDEPNADASEPSWIFGTHACLVSEGHVAPRGGSKARQLVPVVYSPNDVIYFLDAQGRAYAQDTIENTSAVLYAEDGTALVCRILLHEAIFLRKETSLELRGLQGDELAQRLSLHLIQEASDNGHRFFSDATGDILVMEEVKAKRTQFAGATQQQLALVKTPVNAEDANAEWTPFLDKPYLRIVGEERTSLPDFFDHLPDLRDVDVSINRLATLPDSLWRATQITNLNLSFNPLTALPGIANMKALRSLSLRGCPFATLPDILAGAKNLTKLLLTECEELDVDAALLVIAKLPKLKDLSLPLSPSLTSLAPLANSSLKSLYLSGARVKQPSRLPAGLGLLQKLTDLRIEYADDIALLPEAPEDVRALRLIFSKKFTDADIKKSALNQPAKLYLQAFADTL